MRNVLILTLGLAVVSCSPRSQVYARLTANDWTFRGLSCQDTRVSYTGNNIRFVGRDGSEEIARIVAVSDVNPTLAVMTIQVRPTPAERGFAASSGGRLGVAIQIEDNAIRPVAVTDGKTTTPLKPGDELFDNFSGQRCV